MISYKRQLPLRYLKHSDAPHSDIMSYLPQSERIIWSSSVRLGLLDIFSSLSFEEGEFVLLPAIAPQGLVLPLQKKGIPCIFYHLKDGFDVDTKSVEELIQMKGCRVLVFIHYFGRFNPQIHEVKRICEKHQVYLFEDAVHGLFGKDDEGHPLGSIGDLSFCSLPKFLPVPDGALFFVNNNGLKIILKEKRNLFWNGSIFFHIVSLLLNQVASKCKKRGSYVVLSCWSKLNYAVYYRLLCGLMSNHGVSGLTQTILRHINLEEFIHDRKETFAQINSHYGFYPEAFMSPGYPIFTIDAQKERSAWKANNVETLSYLKGWQYVPASSDFDFERKLQLSHFLLPLNSDIVSCL